MRCRKKRKRGWTSVCAEARVIYPEARRFTQKRLARKRNGAYCWLLLLAMLLSLLLLLVLVLTLSLLLSLLLA
jgi:hypothetical protein